MTEQTDASQAEGLDVSDTEARRIASTNFLSTSDHLMHEYGPKTAGGVFAPGQHYTPFIEDINDNGEVTKIRVFARYGKQTPEAQDIVILSATVQYQFTEGSKGKNVLITVDRPPDKGDKGLLPLDYLDHATIALAQVFNSFENSGLIPNSEKPDANT